VNRRRGEHFFAATYPRLNIAPPNAAERQISEEWQDMTA
jgi:hypothetical protein